MLVAGPVDHLAGGPELVALLAELGVPLVLTGRRHWEPRGPAGCRLSSRPTPPRRRSGRGCGGPSSTGRWLRLDPADATAQFRLTPEQVADRGDHRGQPGPAHRTAGVDGRLRQGARFAQRGGPGAQGPAHRAVGGLGRPGAAALVLQACLDLALRVRHRDQVLSEWAMRPGGGRGQGVTALFAGDSGTGKTMAAEVISGHLGLDLYVIDLATVVDKYVGETEKNLERVFGEADGINGVLLFDEADAIFGKRSEVRTHHDATPTSRSPTCSSAWRPSTAWPSSPPTCGPTWTTPSPAPRRHRRLPAARRGAPPGAVGALLGEHSRRRRRRPRLRRQFELAGGRTSMR